MVAGRALMLKNSSDAQEFFNLGSEVHPCAVTDFNGVLDTFEGWTGKVEDYSPAEGADWFLGELRALGYKTIIVQTATLPLEHVLSWVRRYHFDRLIDYVTNHKPPAQIYIDDRAILHDGNFERTLQKARDFQPHWSKAGIAPLEEIWPAKSTYSVLDELEHYVIEAKGYSTHGETDVVCGHILCLIDALRQQLGERN